MQNFTPTPQKIFPQIDLDNGFYLREKRESDAENFFNYYSDPEVNKFILCEIPSELEQARRELLYWRDTFYQNDGIYFAIADKTTDKLVGSVGLTGYNSYHSRIELSYDLSRDHWGRGIMTKAIQAVIKYGFEVLKINRIEASVSTQNIVSKNLLLKCGFQIEGVLRQHRYHRGQYVDVYFFSLLKEDFLKI